MMSVSTSLVARRGRGNPFGVYAIGGNVPQTLADFSARAFRVNGARSTAASTYTATRTGLATQLDASGNLVWNAHNLLTYSEDFSNAAWGNAGTTPTVTPNVGAAPDGSLTADRLQLDGTDIIFQAASSVISGLNGTFAVWVKSNTGTDQKFRFLIDGATKADQTATSEWQLFSDSSEVFGGSRNCGIDVASTGESADLLVWGAHAYRSDLGGMAPVPLTRRVAGSTTYVPTTSAAVYLPREEAYAYVDGSLVGPYYQKESDARTNLVTYSEDFTDASWVKGSGSTITANAETSPSGLSDATQLNLTFTGFMQQNFARVVGAQYTVSFWVKSVSGADTLFRLYGEDTILSSDLTATSEWQRFSFTYTSTSSLATRGDGITRPSSNTAVSLYIWGAQFEAGSTPTSYIPTAGSSVIRPADSTTIAAGNMPAYTDALSFQMEGLVTYTDNGIPADTNGTLGEIVFISWKNDNSNFIRQIVSTIGSLTGAIGFQQKAAGVYDEIFLTAQQLIPGINAPFNIAGRHGSTFINGAVDGTALTADLTPTALPDLSATTFDLAPTFNGFIKEFRVWAEDIGDTGISEASQ